MECLFVFFSHSFMYISFIKFSMVYRVFRCLDWIAMVSDSFSLTPSRGTIVSSACRCPAMPSVIWPTTCLPPRANSGFCGWPTTASGTRGRGRSPAFSRWPFSTCPATVSTSFRLARSDMFPVSHISDSTAICCRSSNGALSSPVTATCRRPLICYRRRHLLPISIKSPTTRPTENRRPTTRTTSMAGRRLVHVLTRNRLRSFRANVDADFGPCLSLEIPFRATVNLPGLSWTAVKSEPLLLLPNRWPENVTTMRAAVISQHRSATASMSVRRRNIRGGEEEWSKCHGVNVPTDRSR